MVSATWSPECTTKVFRCPQCFVSCKHAGSDDAPLLSILARRGDRVGAAVRIVYVQDPLAAGQCADVGRRPVEADQPQEVVD